MTEVQLLDAVREARARLPVAKGQPGVTTEEIAEANGLTYRQALNQIVRPLVRAGKLRSVWVSRTRINGITAPVTGWVTVGKKG